MRLAMFEINGLTGLAAAEKDDFHGWTEDQPGYPGCLGAILTAGADLETVGRKMISQAPAVNPETVRFRPPLARPGKIICLGMNYVAHTQELGRGDQPDYPAVFARFATTLVGHREPLIKPAVSDQFDYEGELALVIGRGGRNITRARALEHVAAYSIFNDASVRDFQVRGAQWTPGKNFDGTGGFGPWLVTAGSLPPGARGLRLTTRLNGQVMQEADTADMVFDIAEQIVILSQIMTLEPGDLFITGTPGGVGLSREPRVFMKDGDECEVEIEGIGVLQNPVRQG